MARSKRRGPRIAGPLEGICPRCDTTISDFSAAVKRHGVWIHRSCAPGADDE